MCDLNADQTVTNMLIEVPLGISTQLARWMARLWGSERVYLAIQGCLSRPRPAALVATGERSGAALSLVAQLAPTAVYFEFLAWPLYTFLPCVQGT